MIEKNRRHGGTPTQKKRVASILAEGLQKGFENTQTRLQLQYSHINIFLCIHFRDQYIVTYIIDRTDLVSNNPRFGHRSFLKAHSR